MTLVNTANNVDLVVDVAPNPLGGQHGKHTIWLNNNNSWTAAIASADVSVRNATSAELDLVVSGNRVRHRGINVGNVGAWRSSKRITTTLAEVPGATSSGEFVDVTCSISRAPMVPNLPPPRLYPLHLSALVSL